MRDGRILRLAEQLLLMMHHLEWKEAIQTADAKPLPICRRNLAAGLLGK